MKETDVFKGTKVGRHSSPRGWTAMPEGTWCEMRMGDRQD